MGCIKIALTGAPGTGKTVVIDQLDHLGHACFHEIIRTMTAKEKQEGKAANMVSNPLVFADDPKQFNLNLLTGRIQQYENAGSLDKDHCFFDRGIPDVLAYMDYFGQSYGSEFIEAATKFRYDVLFIMPPWKEIYVRDNERLETFKEAEQLHRCLMHTYHSFGYDPIVVPKTSIEKRVTFILDYVTKG